ncbi:MAG: ABC transporter permease [Planctomycetota bacterium]
MRLLTVAIATWREAVRQPVSILILCIAAAVTFLSQYLNMFHFSEESSYNAIRQMSVASTLMSGVIIAIFSASAVLAEEIENRTVLTLLAKPIRRHELVLGKFLGILLAISLAFLVMMAISLVTSCWVEVGEFARKRANPALIVPRLPKLTSGQGAIVVAGTYRDGVNRTDRRTRLPSGIDYMKSVGDLLLLTSGQSSTLVARAPMAAEVEQPGTRWSWQPSPGLASLVDKALVYLRDRTPILLEAFALAFMQVTVMTAVAVAVATRLPLVFNALLCAAIFVLGNLASPLQRALLETEGAGGVAGVMVEILTWPVILLCFLLPNFENFNLTQALAEGREHVPSGALTYGIIYGLVYTALVLAIAVALFQRREVA